MTHEPNDAASDAKTQPYPDVDPGLKFPDLEARILQFWRDEGIFEASVSQREGGENGDGAHHTPPRTVVGAGFAPRS